MFRIAVCDDDEATCMKIESFIIENKARLSQKIHIEVFMSGDELCSFLQNGYGFDLIILDIEMKLLNGIEAGKIIREDFGNEVVQILYISAKNNYAMQLFDIRPLNFLIKPINSQKLIAEVEKAIALSEKGDYFFEYTVGWEFYKTPLKEILYFESNNRKLVLATKKEKIEFYGKLSDVETKLADMDFISIHKSILVNMFHVVEYYPDGVKLSNNEVLPISQSHRRKIRKYILNK